MIDLSAIGVLLAGKVITFSYVITAETYDLYMQNDNGTLTITWVDGGSGLFSLQWGSTTYYLGDGSPTLSFSGLNSDINYSFTITDLGTTSIKTWKVNADIPYDTSTKRGLIKLRNTGMSSTTSI